MQVLTLIPAVLAAAGLTNANNNPHPVCIPHGERKSPPFVAEKSSFAYHETVQFVTSATGAAQARSVVLRVRCIPGNPTCNKSLIQLQMETSGRNGDAIRIEVVSPASERWERKRL